LIRGSQYVVPFATVSLVVFSGWLLISSITRPTDTVLIEVVPLEDPTEARVQVSGAVAKPGVFILPAGSTVQDAIDAAGGFTGSGGLSGDQLATHVRDGLIVDVSALGLSTPVASEPVDINTASAEELDRLPGIGPALANRIIAYRAEQGRFESVDDLARVSGISARMVDDMRHLIAVTD
jgi:competence protein ComEA